MILHLDDVGSTSDWLRMHAADLPDGQWVTARRQTAGRGRMGRAWAAPQGNFAGSCLVRRQPGEGAPAELGFVAALALHDVVGARAPHAQLSLKWPNDLLLDGAKLSGILLEREGDIVILGIGVNLAVAPPLPDRPTASLAGVGVQIAPEPFAEQLADALAARRLAWRTQGFAPVRRAWLERAHPVGTPLQLASGKAGRFAGLADDGALLLDDALGTRHQVHAGDVWLGVPDGAGGEAG